MNKCQLDNPPFYQCCCQCYNRAGLLEDTNVEGLIITQHTGFVCTLRLHDYEAVEVIAEHSCGCECFDDRRLE
jgi:hypothetical protein